MIKTSFRSRIFAILLAFSALIIMTGCLKSGGSSVKGNVSGKIFDSNGKALFEARVEIYGTSQSTIADEMGRYIIIDIEPGEKKLVVTYKEESVVKIVDIPRGETLEEVNFTFSVVDGLPPVITEVRVDELTENTVNILWTTNEFSDSHVDYSNFALGLASNVITVSDSSMVTEHKVALIDLLPGRTYYYRVKSFDFKRNEGVSSDYQFSTPSGAAPSIPTSFAITAPTIMEKITLTWAANTETDLAGYNIYRAESLGGTFNRLNADPVVSTTYEDEGLKIAMKYHYQIKAIDIAGNESPTTQILSVVTPGTLAENRIWKASEGSYIIQGDIRIRGGSVLTIEPGVRVEFTEKDSLPDSLGSSMTDLIVQGGLMSVGSENSRIVFTSAEDFPRQGNWGGIDFVGTNQVDNMLRYSTITFADEGIMSEGSTPSIENCEIGLCGIGVNIGLSMSLNIRYNTVRDCDVGMISTNSNVRNNIFTDNQVGIGVFGNDYFENNTVDCLIGVQVIGGNPIIKNNIIAYTGNGNALYGIDQTTDLATPTISFNDIYNYSIPQNGTVGTGTANIEIDPLFIGGIPYDYKLQSIADGNASDSPCLTAGENGVQLGRYGP